MLFRSDSTIRVYRKANIELQPGVTVLVGCNGSGKSTLIQLMTEQLNKEDIKFINFDNHHDGGSHSFSKAGFLGNYELLAGLFQSSEGEQIIINLEEHAKAAGNYTRRIKTENKQTEAWYFFDAIDSGLSIDNIEDVKTYLFDTIMENNNGLDTYIIVSANSYEVANRENCFDVIGGKYINFENYEDYKKFILQTKELKDKRYN